MQNRRIVELEVRILQAGECVKTFSLTSEGEYSFGRSASCHVTINRDGLSRTHLLLGFQDGQAWVKDVSSTGSSIQGQALKQGQKYYIADVTTLDLGGVLGIDIHPEFEAETEMRPPLATSEYTLQNTATQAISELMARLKVKGELIIGRSEGCDLVIPSLQVSRRHAILRLIDDDLSLEDLDTTNGTYVNGNAIKGRVVIQARDSIIIGSQQIVLEGEAADIQYAIVANNIEKVYPSGFIGLNKTSLKIASREFVALMGPSGCGKSTLLKCLNGANPITSGEIIIQGLTLNNANFNTLKKHIGYVPQDDIVHRELSVEKTLYYAAKLRMAKDVSNEEINQKIDQVLQSLNLDAASIRKNKISELSGGQRKRISIAVELLNDPTILFLDEPTSPLDPETIGDFLTCVRGLAESGQTVIMVTHKPSDLDYVDKVIFLSKGGYQTFYGNKNEVLPHFGASNIIKIYSMMKNVDEGKTWNTRWEQQNPNTRLSENAEPLEPRPATSLIRQFYWLSARYMNIKWNDYWNLVLLLAQPLIIAFLLIFIFKHLQLSVLFMMAISAVWFGVSNASKEIVSELPIYERERMFNLNIGNYILSKVIVLSFIAFIQVVIFVGISYFSYAGREAEVQLWELWPNIGFMFFLSVSSTIFGLFLSAIFSNTEKVMTFVPIALMPQIMLAGIIAKMDSDLKMVLSYFTLGRWGTEGFAHIQDRSATTMNKWADANESVPAGVMQLLPSPPAVNPGVPAGPQMSLQPQAAVDQLGFYAEGSKLISLFAESLSGVIIAVMALNTIFTLGIYLALRRKDAQFI